MITTGVSSINETVQKTHDWLMELERIGHFTSEAQAYTALHAVLQTLRDRLTVDEAAQLGAQLPMLIRGIYYEGWKPSAMPGRARSRSEFLGRISTRLGNADLDPEAACTAVFDLLRRRIAAGEIRDVQQMMHHTLRDLWPAPLTPTA